MITPAIYPYSIGLSFVEIRASTCSMRAAAWLSLKLIYSDSSITSIAETVALLTMGSKVRFNLP